MERSPAASADRMDGSSGRPVTGNYVRATVAYDGTDFLGFQWQTRGRTVQGVLEQALARVCGIRSPSEEAPWGEVSSLRGEVPSLQGRVIAAGRTDAGVHARGQVVGFRTTWRHPLAELKRALNAVLPEDVAIQQLEPAEADWHPRFSAVRRTYRYTVLNRPVRSPLDRRYALHVERPLDLAALKAGAQVLVGEHDFASFGQPTKPRQFGMKSRSSGMSRTGEEGTPWEGSAVRPGEASHCAAQDQGGFATVRCIYEADWTRQPPEAPEGGDWLTFDVSGNAFLRGMVRSIVGSLLQVGLGLWPPERIAEVLALRERGACAPPAPACGLCLMRVDYEVPSLWGDEQLSGSS